jgi:hypothetical protein
MDLVVALTFFWAEEIPRSAMGSILGADFGGAAGVGTGLACAGADEEEEEEEEGGDRTGACAGTASRGTTG